MRMLSRSINKKFYFARIDSTSGNTPLERPRKLESYMIK